MKRIRSILTSIRGKSLVGFVVIILLVLTMIVAGFYQLTQVSAASAEVVPDTEQIEYVQNFALSMSALEADLDRFFVTGGVEFEDNIRAELSFMQDILSTLQAQPNEATAETINKLSLATENLERDMLAFLDADQSSWSPNALNRALINLYAQIDQVIELQQQLSTETLANLRNVAEVQQSIIDNVNTQFVVLGIAILLIAIAAAIVMTRILRPIGTLTEISLDIASGNLDREAPVESNDEIGTLAQAFNSMTGQVRDLVDNLENRVAARTQDLNLAAEIGRQVSRVSNLDDVLSKATTSIKDEFGLYQVQIYLSDPRKENLILRASDGHAGSRLLDAGHQLPIDDHSLNGSAAYNKQAVIVANTQESERFRPNPLLPDTRSEMVVPLMTEDEVLGVIDLQSTEANSLSEDILPAFTVLAGQLAIAIMNARQNRAMQENQRLLRAIIDSTPDWVIVKSRENRYLLVNQSFSDYIGIPVEDMTGKDDIEIGFDEELVKGNPEKGIPGFWPEDQQVMDSGEVFQKDDILDDFDQIRYNSTVKTPLRDADDNVTGLVIFVHDITQQKKSEKLVAKRAEELQTVAELSTAVAATPDPQQLLQNMIDLTKERFDLYHAHIYLLDESGKKLVLAAGAGDVGKMMVAEGRFISLNQEQSLVAQAARSRESVIVNNVMMNPGFLPNPLLFDTRAEMAVPMVVGGQVLGVLDVQSNVMNRFTSDDAQIQMTLAAQTAVALQNARQFAQTQQALADANMFNQLVDASSQGISITSLQGRTLHLNPAMVNILRQATGLEEDFQAKPLGEFYPEEAQIRYQTEIIPAVLEYGSWQGEMWLGDPNQPIITYENHFLLRDEEGNPTHAAAVITDITEQKETEDAIRANQNLMRTIIDSTPDWIIVKSRENRYLLVNQAFAEYMGFPAEEMVGKNDLEIGFEEELVKGNPEKGIVGFWPEDQGVMDGGEEVVFPAGAVEMKGKTHFFATRKTPIKNVAGDVTGLVVFTQDVTQQEKAREEQAQLAQALEEQLHQVTALQRAMTRDNWVKYIDGQQKDETGFAFTGKSVEPFDSNSLKALTGGLPIDPDMLSQIAYDESQTAVLLPLQLHNESIGVVGARNANGNPINAEQRALLTTLTAQVAESLDRARLFEETETARSQTEALFTGSENVVRSTSLKDILAALVEATALKNMERATLLFFNRAWQDTPPESSTIVATWQNEGIALLADVGTTFSHDTYPLFNFLQKDAPFVIEDFRTFPNLDENSRRLFVEGMGLRTAITIPMVTGNQWIGFVLGLSSTPYHLNENELRQMTSLAGQAATVAQSLRLYQEAASRAEHEQILRQVSDRVYAAPDAETVLRTAAREIGRALGLETFIYLEDPENEENLSSPEMQGMRS